VLAEATQSSIIRCSIVGGNCRWPLEATCSSDPFSRDRKLDWSDRAQEQELHQYYGAPLLAPVTEEARWDRLAIPEFQLHTFPLAGAPPNAAAPVPARPDRHAAPKRNP